VLTELLEVMPGVTAVIGSGGKTTLLRMLAGELAARGQTVLMCTTTHILPFDGLVNLADPGELELEEALRAGGPVCAGTAESATEKLTALPIPMARLARLARYVLVEADGARGLPLKAHAAHEPVLPAQAGQTICVVGLSGLGRPAAQAAHRPEIFARLAGVETDAPVTPEAVARVLNAEGLADRCFFNQADTPERWAQANRIAELLECPAAAGSLLKGVCRLCLS